MQQSPVMSLDNVKDMINQMFEPAAPAPKDQEDTRPEPATE